jgi:hypothetical protein
VILSCVAIGVESIDVTVLVSRPSASCVTIVEPAASVAIEVSGAVVPADVVTE